MGGCHGDRTLPPSARLVTPVCIPALVLLDRNLPDVGHGPRAHHLVVHHGHRNVPNRYVGQDLEKPQPIPRVQNPPSSHTGLDSTSSVTSSPSMTSSRPGCRRASHSPASCPLPMTSEMMEPTPNPPHSHALQLDRRPTRRFHSRIHPLDSLLNHVPKSHWAHPQARGPRRRSSRMSSPSPPRGSSDPTNQHQKVPHVARRPTSTCHPKAARPEPTALRCH